MQLAQQLPVALACLLTHQSPGNLLVRQQQLPEVWTQVSMLLALVALACLRTHQSPGNWLIGQQLGQQLVQQLLEELLVAASTYLRLLQEVQSGCLSHRQNQGSLLIGPPLALGLLLQQVACWQVLVEMIGWLEPAQVACECTEMAKFCCVGLHGPCKVWPGF